MAALMPGCIILLLMLIGIASHVKANELSKKPVLSALARPSLAQRNRYLEANAGIHQQNYFEQDTSGLISNGMLDSESGKQNTIGTTLRWQFDSSLLLQAKAQHQSGATNYSGYLQAGSTLTPYHATTGNIAVQYDINVGYALNAFTWDVMPENWQFVPLLHYRHNQWQRNLVQYNETYNHATVAAGALLQWQPQPGTVLEVIALRGQARNASMSAPSLGFATTQLGGVFHEWQLATSQNVGVLTGVDALNQWRVTARFFSTRYGHKASPIINGYQAPPNQHSPRSWLLGIQWQF